jgi:hypothetical protein
MGAKFEKSTEVINIQESPVIVHLKRNNTGWFWPDKWENPVLVSMDGDKVYVPFLSRFIGKFEAIVLDGKVILSEFMSDDNIKEIGIAKQFLAINSPQDIRIYQGEVNGFKRISFTKEGDEITKMGETINVAGIQIRATRSEI